MEGVLAAAPPCPICRSTASEAYETPDPTPVRRCAGCGARWVWPVPLQRELRDRYRDEHERGEWGRRFDGTAQEEWARRAEVVSRYAPVDERPAVLDVGCGDGRFLDAMVGLGWRTLGSEIAFAGARLASGRHPVLVGELSAVVTGPVFHAITFWDVLEHLPDPAGHVREASRLLVPGGVMAISMPNLRGTASLVLGRRWSYYDFGRYGHLHHLSPRHLERLLGDAGMAPVHQETGGSVDLRDVPEAYGLGSPSGFATWILDRLSGVVARVAEPAGFGNTALVVGRKPGAGLNGPVRALRAGRSRAPGGRRNNPPPT